MSNIRQVSRRNFLKTGGVLVVGVSLFGCGKEKVPGLKQSVAGEPW